MKKVRLRLGDFLKNKGLSFYKACEVSGIPDSKLRKLSKAQSCTLKTLELLLNRFDVRLEDLVEVVELRKRS